LSSCSRPVRCGLAHSRKVRRVFARSLALQTPLTASEGHDVGAVLSCPEPLRPAVPATTWHQCASRCRTCMHEHCLLFCCVISGLTGSHLRDRAKPLVPLLRVHGGQTAPGLGPPSFHSGISCQSFLNARVHLEPSSASSSPWPTATPRAPSSAPRSAASPRSTRWRLLPLLRARRVIHQQRVQR